MSTITREFTKEQLVEHLRTRIEHRKGLIASMHIDRGYRDYLKLELRSSEIALASLEAEPVGYFYSDKPGDWYQLSDGDRVQSHRRIPLYANPQSSPVVKLPNEFISSEGIVVQIEKLMAVLAVHGIQYERKGNACRAAMLQSFGNSEQLNSPVIPDDVQRMDWLVSKTVNVREPLVYGSHNILWSQAITDEQDDHHATKLREQIDAAMAAENAAAPQQEVKP
ncbi:MULTISPECIES: hypothetical protein [Enterobacter]|uniref:hypothetical protein n=1 Tax=Enterobacter TaxID=547 RepID=UPI00067C9DDC|nr:MULTISPECIES: hypothetical protein [Enterobacter cloacae complex]MCD2460421.1 hypothetical protein [Enterobacter cloacae complex sp. 2021EL-01261]